MQCNVVQCNALCGMVGYGMYVSMDEWRDGLMDEWMDGCMDAGMLGFMHICTICNDGT